MQNDIQNQKAENYIKKGKKISFLQKIFTSPKERLQKTLHYYKKGSLIFEKTKNHERAAQIQISSALLKIQILQYKEAAFLFSLAAENYKKNDDFEDSINTLKKSVEIYHSLGDFEKSGENLEKIGDIYLMIKKNTLAANFYKESAEIFSLSKKNFEKVNFLNLKIGFIYSKFVKNKEKLKEAFQIYEDFAYDCLDKEFERKKLNCVIFFKCVLLFMIFENFEKAKILFLEYREMDEVFEKSDFSRFLEKLFFALGESGEVYFRTVGEFREKIGFDDATEGLLEEIYNFKNQDILEDESAYFMKLKS